MMTSTAYNRGHWKNNSYFRDCFMQSATGIIFAQNQFDIFMIQWLWIKHTFFVAFITNSFSENQHRGIEGVRLKICSQIKHCVILANAILFPFHSQFSIKGNKRKLAKQGLHIYRTFLAQQGLLQEEHNPELPRRVDICPHQLNHWRLGYTNIFDVMQTNTTMWKSWINHRSQTGNLYSNKKLLYFSQFK